jgi:hypothetical protein
MWHKIKGSFLWNFENDSQSECQISYSFKAPPGNSNCWLVALALIPLNNPKTSWMGLFASKSQKKDNNYFPDTV